MLTERLIHHLQLNPKHSISVASRQTLQESYMSFVNWRTGKPPEEIAFRQKSTKYPHYHWLIDFMGYPSPYGNAGYFQVFLVHPSCHPFPRMITKQFARTTKVPVWLKSPTIFRILLSRSTTAWDRCIRSNQRENRLYCPNTHTTPNTGTLVQVTVANRRMLDWFLRCFWLG